MIITYGEYKEALLDGELVKRAVIKRLYNEFKDEIDNDLLDLYKEPTSKAYKTDEGFVINDFPINEDELDRQGIFVKVINIPERTGKFLRTVERTYQFEIRHWYQFSPTPNKDADTIGHRIMECLKTIPLPTVMLDSTGKKLETIYLNQRKSRMNFQKGDFSSIVYVDYKISLSEDDGEFNALEDDGEFNTLEDVGVELDPQ